MKGGYADSEGNEGDWKRTKKEPQYASNVLGEWIRTSTLENNAAVIAASYRF